MPRRFSQLERETVTWSSSRHCQIGKPVAESALPIWAPTCRCEYGTSLAEGRARDLFACRAMIERHVGERDSEFAARIPGLPPTAGRRPGLGFGSGLRKALECFQADRKGNGELQRAFLTVLDQNPQKCPTFLISQDQICHATRALFLKQNLPLPYSMGHRTQGPSPKVILAGGAGVRQTLLIRQCVHAGFFPTTCTVAPSQRTKPVTLSGGQQIDLQVWDTAGQERYQTMAIPYFRDALVALLCCTLFVTEDAEFDRSRTRTDLDIPLTTWIGRIAEHTPPRHNKRR
jgi:hypothetical protein